MSFAPLTNGRIAAPKRGDGFRLKISVCSSCPIPNRRTAVVKSGRRGDVKPLEFLQLPVPPLEAVVKPLLKGETACAILRVPWVVSDRLIAYWVHRGQTEFVFG